ncbi:hypothetical protein HPP92_001434 [Vanilla planifolia]|uniref:Saposin B-type domain-containing protein n=1 Tax=Vanilla planifolia TaxID=51239 RepID=A0A835SCW8_VANPL|nr:hypothetical protein HPP92_001689 [Vanilla planifolia]KAG0501362.1 hypothetical protein HPP92_001434 [Vanilla planifolia]
MQGLVLCLALLLGSHVLISAVEDKCSACYAIADEIEIELANEKPVGQRDGKVINRRDHEQRVLELLDGLCDKMKDHTLEKLDTGEEMWVKVHDWNHLPDGKDEQESRAFSKYISSFCARLLEETKDELIELLKRGGLKHGEINKALCQDLTKHCELDE